LTILVYDRVQLSIYSTRALFHKYCVTMKYTRMCKCLILSERPQVHTENTMTKLAHFSATYEQKNSDN